MRKRFSRHRSMATIGLQIASAIRATPEVTSLAERNRHQMDLANAVARELGMEPLDVLVAIAPLYAARHPQLKS